eukprot:XP_001183518.1 PREDICTED: uncharacterized protein LOC753831 [Strongylocentrotus purpuratus]
MMKVFLLTFAYIAMAGGCVTGGRPSWELGCSTCRGTSGGSSQPGIPVEVARYFAGLVSKESAFASIDLDGNGLVCIQEWKLGGGAVTEFSNLLIRLDANGDALISLVELQSFSLPSTTAPTKRTIRKFDLLH